MTEPTTFETIFLVVWVCGILLLFAVTLGLQITIGFRLHRQEGCLGMLMTLNGTHVLLTGWRRVDEFEIRPLMIAYSICVALFLGFIGSILVFLAMTGQLQ